MSDDEPNMDVMAKHFEEMLREQLRETHQLIMEEHWSAMKQVSDKYKVIIGRMKLDHKKSMMKHKKSVHKLLERQPNEPTTSSDAENSADNAFFAEDRNTVLDEKHEQPPPTSPTSLVSAAFRPPGPRVAPAVDGISQEDIHIATVREFSVSSVPSMDSETNGDGHLGTKADDCRREERGPFQEVPHPKNRDGDGLSRCIKPATNTNMMPKGAPDDDPVTESTDDFDMASPERKSSEDLDESDEAATRSWLLHLNKTDGPRPQFTRLSRELFPEEAMMSQSESHPLASARVSRQGRISLASVHEDEDNDGSRSQQIRRSERQLSFYEDDKPRFSTRSPENSDDEDETGIGSSRMPSMFGDGGYGAHGSKILDKKTSFDPDMLYKEEEVSPERQISKMSVMSRKSTFRGVSSVDPLHPRLPSRMQDVAGNFNLRECWEIALEDRCERRSVKMDQASKRGMLMKGKKSKSSSSNSLTFGQGPVLMYREMLVTESHPLQRYILHPHSRPRVSWSMLGILLVLYDIVTVPLLVFEIPALPVWALSLMTAFWTTDICLSLITGYEVNGQMEMRPKRVMSKYLRTWLVLDAFTVIPEWVVIFYETSNPETVSRLGDTFRFSRIFRCARVIRVLKMRQFVEKMQDRLNSENSRAFFGISKHMVYIVIINHFLACAWFALGNSDKGGWVYKADGNIPEREMGYQYLTSLHWSLSQLHGTMEVHPYTIPERLFSTVVLILAVLCASWIVSSITNMMIQVQQARESYLRDKSTLRRYLAEYNISTQLSMQVKSYADELLERQRTKAREVHVLAQLPPSLRMDIEYEIHARTLHVHALFHAYCSGFLITIRSLCHSALTTAVLFQGNQIFSEGEAAKNMFFVIDGSLTYTWKYRDIFVSDGEWLCESVLWIYWVHCGDFTAAGMCNNMLTVNADAFLEIVIQHRKTRVFTAGYAEAYINALNQVDMDEISDIFYMHAGGFG